MSKSLDIDNNNKNNKNKPSSSQTNGIFVHHAEAIWERREPYGGLYANHYALLCAAFAALGGMIFGYDQVKQRFTKSSKLA